MPKVHKTSIEFREIKIHPKYGKSVKRIYHVVENGRAIALEPFSSLDDDVRDKVKDLISKMATNKDYKSDIIRYRLQGYTYGEIRPMPHRFFFFQKCGDNLIFFGYVEKKKNSLKDSIYRELERKKEKYEKEFEAFIARIRQNI